MLSNDNIKYDQKYELCWSSAIHGTVRAAYKSAKCALAHLHNSEYEGFKNLSCPELQVVSPVLPIPQLAFLSVKISKAFHGYLSKTGMNHSHGPGWAAECVSLDQNYRKSVDSGVSRFVLFDRQSHYEELSITEMNRIMKHSTFQVIPDQ